jgi:Calreticulin family
LFNGESLSRGDLLEDFNPPVNPPAEIDDPEDKKPDDWVDASRIPDPDAQKPDDWDEDAPYEIVDEDAEKPEGWLDEEPLNIPDPGAYFPVCGVCPILMHAIQMLRNLKSGKMMKMAIGSPLQFPTPNAVRPPAAASGNGKFLVYAHVVLVNNSRPAVPTSRTRIIKANGMLL